MGGFMGFGDSSEKTDRGAQLGARQGMWNIFNWAMPEGQQQRQVGMATLDPAKQYWASLLQPGRTGTAMQAAPAINSAIAGSDAARRQAAAMGTGRTGGTAAVEREAGMGAQSSIDDLINQNLFAGRAMGAKGLQEISAAEMQDAMAMLGLGAGSAEKILDNATESRALSYAINRGVQYQWGQAIGSLLKLALGAKAK